MSAYSVIVTAAAGLVTGIFNSGIAGAGYIAPETVGIAPEFTDAIQKIIKNSDGTFSVIFNQPEAITTIFTFFFVGLEAIAGLVFAAMLTFVNVENSIPLKQRVIRARQRKACEAEGKEWVEPEVRAAAEQAELNAEAEKYYREELREKCMKKGLDYDTELRKHTEAVRIKEEKAAEKARIAEEKAARRAEEAETKRQARYAKMSDEEKLAREERKRKAEKKARYEWLKESVYGEYSYERAQAELAARKEEQEKIERLRKTEGDTVEAKAAIKETKAELRRRLQEIRAKFKESDPAAEFAARAKELNGSEAGINSDDESGRE